MATTVEVLERPPVASPGPRAGGAGGGVPAEHNGRDDGGPGPAADPTRFGLWLFLATISMLFIGFTSAYLVRRNAADWRPLVAPPILWANTLVLLASSVLLELSRARALKADVSAARRWLLATGTLGVGFLGGQVKAWKALAAQGLFLSSGPHSSFFYLLSGVHLVHILGGLVWLAVTLTFLRPARAAGAGRRVSLLATFWHFLAGLWLYLLLLLFVL